MSEPQEQPLVTEEVVKPKRTRRPKVSEAAEVAAPAPQAAEAAVAAAEAPAEPKRAPRRRKAAEPAAEADGAPAAAEPAVAAPVVDVVAVAEAPVEAKPRRAPRKKVVAEAQAALDLSDVPAKAAAAEEAPKEVASHGVLELGPETAEPAATQGDAAEGAAVQADGRAPRQRDRNKRGDRAERGDRADRGDRPPRGPRPERLAAEGDAQVAQAGEAGDAAPELDADGRPSRRAVMAAEQTQEVYAELLSGAFDEVREEEAAEAEGEEAAAYKRVLRPEPDAPKLQKVLAQAGVGSRRDIEQMIEDGRIEVNDQVAHIGQRISFGDRIKVAGRPIKVRIQPPAARILAYHKPTGEVVTHDDPQGRPTVFRRLPRLQNGKWMSVGRLDLNTEGLLLFTNSGELANQLMHPRFGVEREYAVRVLGKLEEAARERLLTGVEIEGQAAAFVSISKGEGEGVNQWYRVVITEGRNREVRKLFDAVGLTVNRLIRVRYGAIVLPRGLKRGVWVELGESDVRAVKSLAGMDRQEFGQGQGQGRQGKQGGQQGNRAQQGGQGQQRAEGGFKGKNGRNGPQQGQGAQGGRQGGQGGQGGYGPQGNGGNKPPRFQNDRPQQERQVSPRHDDDDFDHIGPIPNPLEQTFDKRFAKGSKRITAGFGRPDQNHGRDSQPKGGPKQPDPLQTSVGYIGADAYFGKVGGGGGRRGGGGGGGRGRR